jgi:acyl carrier protein
MSTPEPDSLPLIRQVIGKYCDAPPETIVPEATLADLNVDSLSLAEMLFALEDTLGVPIAEPTERPQTVADLQRLVAPHVGVLSATAATDRQG